MLPHAMEFYNYGAFWEREKRNNEILAKVAKKRIALGYFLDVLKSSMPKSEWNILLEKLKLDKTLIEPIKEELL